LFEEIFERFATPAAKAKEAARMTSEPIMPIGHHRSSPDEDLDRAWAEARLQGRMRELAQTGEGERNDRLYRAVLKCAQCVPLGLLTESEIVQAAEEACRMNGLAMDKESGGMSGARATIRSAMEKGKANPYPIEEIAARRRTNGRGRAMAGVALAEAGRPSGGMFALNTYAFANLDRWVPQLGEHAKRQEDGRYVIAADDGEVLSDTIVVTPNVIDDGASTLLMPTDLVARWFGMLREDAADHLANWLGFELLIEEGTKPKKRHVLPELDDPKDGRPTIKIHARAFKLAAKQSEKAVLAKDLPVYVRGEKLRRPVVMRVLGAKGQPTSVASLAEIKLPIMQQMMDDAAVYVRPGPEKGPRWVPTPPPKEVAELMLARAGYWPFPQIVGIITAPTLRPDGSLLDSPGYDPATRLYLAGPPILPPISERPSREEAMASLAGLDALLDEFPFEDGASRSVALSTLITPVVRGMLAHTPIHAFTAPAAGTGKSYLADLASAIVTGFLCPVQAVGRTDEEIEKRLTGSLLRGNQLISLDNINGVFGSDLLCQIVTQDRVEVRPLGTSEKVEVEPRATVFINGNNLALTGDLIRRAIVARLDARMEKPHERQFKGNPFEQIIADRGRFIADTLTVVKAYVAAGRPDVHPRLVSFEDWSDNVRSALVWLGCADPCDTMERARDDDPELGKVVAFFEAWSEELGTDGEYKVSDLVQAVTEYGEDNPLLREAVMAIAGHRGAIDANKLGNWLKQNRDKMIGRLRLVQNKKLSQGKPRWRLWNSAGAGS
jgi:putative DNA primase/helicase